MTILIVDDSSVNLKLLKAILEAEGHRTVEANDGVEALAALEREGADAIISDILMPNMDGYRLCLEVRRSERFHHIPFIAYTATYVSEGDEQVALDLGADFFIRKPSPAAVMLESLRLAVARRGRKKSQQGVTEDYNERVAESLQKMRDELNSRLAISKLNEQLEKSNKKLTEFDRFKSEFLASASHEMRTPLAIIREFASIVADGVAGELNGTQGECMEAVLRNCDRLTALLDELLDLAKIESGRLPIRRESMDISSLVTECVNDFNPSFRRKSQSLHLDLGSDPVPCVLADRSKVHQALINLIGNAHKFTQEGGTVVVSVQVKSKTVLLQVSDNGPGIDGLQLEAIFNAFTQLDRKDGGGSKGTGLGLTITRKIIELQGGEIKVRSKLGHGATFSIEIPIYSPDLEQEAFFVDQTRIMKDGTVLNFLAVADDPRGPSMERVKELWSLAMPSAIVQSWLCSGDLQLYSIESTEPATLKHLRTAFKDRPTVQVDFTVESRALDAGRARKSLRKLKARLLKMRGDQRLLA